MSTYYIGYIDKDGCHHLEKREFHGGGYYTLWPKPVHYTVSGVSFDEWVDQLCEHYLAELKFNIDGGTSMDKIYSFISQKIKNETHPTSPEI